MSVPVTHAALRSSKREFVAMLERMRFRLRGVMAVSLSCMLLAGCIGRLVTSPPPNTYDLTGPAGVSTVRGKTGGPQILVPSPTALQILAGQRIVVAHGSLLAFYPNAQYPDTLPNVLQARIIETFERSKLAHAAGRPGEGLSIDYQLLTDIRSFNIVVQNGGMEADVELSARIMNDRTGRVVDFKVFRAAVPIAADTAPAAVAGLNTALDQVLIEMADWVLTRV